jgi:cyclopropane fatty-acyl-phospholipid synthase-like methyltransferase
VVIGVDLSPIQPNWYVGTKILPRPRILTPSRVPPNCTFEVDDLEKPWLWEQPFDYIHSANIAQGIRDFRTYTKRIYDNLRPGGVVQFQETRTKFGCDDDSIPKGGFIEKYEISFNKAAGLAGFEDATYRIEEYMRDTGFVDVRVVVKKLPIGPWPKTRVKKVS